MMFLKRMIYCSKSTFYNEVKKGLIEQTTKIKNCMKKIYTICTYFLIYYFCFFLILKVDLLYFFSTFLKVDFKR